jgi:hypothetical protein
MKRIVFFALVLLSTACNTSENEEIKPQAPAPTETTSGIRKEPLNSGTSTQSVYEGENSRLTWNASTHDWRTIYCNVPISFYGPSPTDTQPNFYFTMGSAYGSAEFSGDSNYFQFKVPYVQYVPTTVRTCTYDYKWNTTYCTTRTTVSYKAGGLLNFSGRIIKMNGEYYCVEKVINNTQIPVD